MPLTDVAIRNAKPREKPYKARDTLALFLLVQAPGGKLWWAKYRNSSVIRERLKNFDDISDF